MLCVWQGHIASVPWPRHEPARADLTLELWAPRTEPQLPAGEAARLEFSKFVCLGDVPLWAIAGPEMHVFSSDSSSVRFFSELAAVQTGAGERVALRAALPHHGDVSAAAPGTRHRHLLLYAVRDAGDESARIAARVLVLEPALAVPLASPRPMQVATLRDPQPRPRQPLTLPEPAPAGPPVAPAAAPPAAPAAGAAAAPQTGARTPLPVADPLAAPALPKQGIPDVKRAIQQTVLGALRLRGIRRDNPDFKTMYTIISRATEFALRGRAKDDVAVTDVHDKVEALLAIIE